MEEQPIQLKCSINKPYQNRCSLTASENGVEDTIGILRIMASFLSLLGCTAIILLVIAKRQLKNPKVHPIFALAMTDILLSFLWILGSSAWLMGIENRRLCFLISVPTVILECVTVNLTFVYAMLAYYGIRSKRPETLVLQRPDSEIPNKALSQRATVIAYLVAGALPAAIVVSVFGIVVISSNYKMVTDTNDCSCWCFPTLGNVLPLAIPVDNMTAQYTHHIYVLETTYGAIVGTNYLVVFILLIVVYTKSLIYIKKMRKQLENNKSLHASSVVLLIEKGQTKAKRSVFAFLTVFLVSGLWHFVLAYTILWLEIHFFASGHVHSWITPNKYHELRKHSIIQILFVLLYLQSLTVPLQGFLNAIVYAWTKDDFLRVMGLPGDNNDDIIEYDDDDRHDEDMERSLIQGNCNKALEDSATISIRSTPVDNLSERNGSRHVHVVNYSSTHDGYNTY